MEPTVSVSTVSHVIQLAVAPVFLLSGVGAMMRVSVPPAIALMFIAAILALIAGLLSFLRETALATGNIHVKKARAALPLCALL